MKPQDSPTPVALPPLPAARGLRRLWLLPGTLARLGLPALARYARHRLTRTAALPADLPAPVPPFLHAEAQGGPAPDWFGPLPAPMRALPALAVPTAGPFDIRQVWEAGRLVDLPAVAARDPAAAESVLRDFLRANPPFRGPHWACGQEAAIRLVHLLAAREAIGAAMLPGLAGLVALHCRRIAATLDYAMAQDNNHAVSEAAGLWVAGMALGDAAGAARGRALLERAVLRLFAPSGAFSQQSMRYHVVALEMAAFAVRTARAQQLGGLSPAARDRLAAGVGWLARISDPASGRGWRVGPDDSSRFLAAPPDDVRPALARAHAAFGASQRPADSGTAGAWLDPDGGFAALQLGSLRAYMRLPVHRFRPGQADALHLELWQGSGCLLGDAGTALYNFTADPTAPDLARTAAHNTIAFDDDDQMPRLSRFLYGAWLRPAELGAEPGRMWAAYRDWKGRLHRREVRLCAAGVLVEDRFDGPFARAVARFRLPAAPWTVRRGAATGGPFRLTVRGAEGCRLVLLPCAPCYGSWTTTPALEAWASRPGSLAAEITPG